MVINSHVEIAAVAMVHTQSIQRLIEDAPETPTEQIEGVLEDIQLRINAAEQLMLSVESLKKTNPEFSISSNLAFAVEKMQVMVDESFRAVNVFMAELSKRGITVRNQPHV